MGMANISEVIKQRRLRLAGHCIMNNETKGDNPRNSYKS